MDPSIRDFAPHLAALLLGGLSTSLGPAYAARNARAQSALLKISGWALGLVCIGVVVIGFGVVGWIVRAWISDGATGRGAISVSQLLLLGVAIGLPLGVPGILAAWSEAHRRDQADQKRRDRVATKDDRRAYAAQLVAQIKEMSPTPRALTASASGDGGTVLLLQGDVEPSEGEALTSALREDLSDVGFKRVEGKNGTNEWWSRV